ncbi:MAG: hypothetical protein R2800_12235 [Flavipsychrobacter sp.]
MKYLVRYTQHLLLLTFLFNSIFCFAQSNKHVIVPGTKCSIIPPSGFQLVNNFSGFFNQKTGASIMVNKMPTAPYRTVANGFTKEALASEGMTLISKERVHFNNAEATFAKIKQSANNTTYHKLMLLFSISNGVIMINGIYPEGSENEQKIKEAIFSTIYNEKQNDDPLDAVPFKIDISGTDLKYTEYMSGSLLYSVEGKMPTTSPALIVGSSFAKVSTNKREYSIKRLKKLPRGESNVIKSINEIKIDGISGYEIEANGISKDGEENLVYLVLLYNSDNYYILLGTANEAFENNLKQFKKAVKTFKRK